MLSFDAGVVENSKELFLVNVLDRELLKLQLDVFVQQGILVDDEGLFEKGDDELFWNCS